jgi:poly-gamma-glutamate system protein
MHFAALGGLLASVAMAADGPNPHYADMIAAAKSMQAASRILYAEKAAHGLLPPPDADPNMTGMIGLEYNAMTTTPGDVSAKRTTTSPDFAAALVRLVAGLDLPAGGTVVTVLSGSYVGADVAMLAALERLGLRPIMVISAGSSQWGANNPALNIVDMLRLLREKGVIATKAMAMVLGGTDGAGGGQDEASRAALHASAAADDIPVIDMPLGPQVDQLVAMIRSELAGEEPALLVNVGAGFAGTGTCRESFELPPGASSGPIPCTRGTPGILMAMARPGLPVIHVLNVMRLAASLDLPYDPIPLPVPGENVALYGPAPTGR